MRVFNDNFFNNAFYWPFRFILSVIMIFSTNYLMIRNCALKIFALGFPIDCRNSLELLIFTLHICKTIQHCWINSVWVCNVIVMCRSRFRSVSLFYMGGVRLIWCHEQLIISAFCKTFFGDRYKFFYAENICALTTLF